MTQFLIARSPAGNVRKVTATFHYRGKERQASFTHLLADGDDNTKLAKSNRLRRYKTFGLSLAPAKESGYQVCAKASPGCKKACIFTSGYASIFPSVTAGRVARTLLFFEDREVFEQLLRQDMLLAGKKAQTESKTLVIRLNVFSDLPWEKVTPWVFEDFPRIRMMDYSKIINRVLDRDLPPNYDLTFSRSETNDEECAEVLARGGRVAMVFAVKPRQWKTSRPKTILVGGREYRVADGDRHDLRFLDPKGVVVGLYAKGAGRKDDTGFVIRPKAGDWVVGKPRRVSLALKS